MAMKKSQLYSSLWQSCDELRGGMDASQYKDYVLTLLFMKYVSDKHAGKLDALIEVPEGDGFADMVKLKGRQGNWRKDQHDHQTAHRSQCSQGGHRSGQLQRREQAWCRQGEAGPALHAVTGVVRRRGNKGPLRPSESLQKPIVPRQRHIFTCPTFPQPPQGL